jgi:hypothetical protein
MNQENRDFDELVDSWVHAAVNNGVTNFNSLLNSLPGVYPSVALCSLNRLVAAGKVSERSFLIETPKKSKNGHKTNYSQVSDESINLPVPHPLDYDWRFSDSATTYLLEYCLAITKPSETIALFGTPSIFQKAKEISFPRKTILLDNNPAVINHFPKNIAGANITLCDIVIDGIPEIEASTVIVDPPWYEKHLLGFMWAATKICRLNGHILISLPPIGTRPGIESDLEQFFEWSKSLGLILAKEEKGILPYNSPPFEINALKAENFHNLHKEWRRGDLAVFVKKEHTSVERPSILPDLEEKWFEQAVQGVRIRLKPYDMLEFKDPKLLTVVKNNIFPTVSRREPLRRLVKVWTSGNRVFACEGRFVLQEILRELASGQSATMALSDKLNRNLTRKEEILIGKSKEQMLEIINTEREENNVFASGNSK